MLRRGRQGWTGRAAPRNRLDEQSARPAEGALPPQGTISLPQVPGGERGILLTDWQGR